VKKALVLLAVLMSACGPTLASLKKPAKEQNFVLAKDHYLYCTKRAAALHEGGSRPLDRQWPMRASSLRVS
jgi:hypothetical protein